MAKGPSDTEGMGGHDPDNIYNLDLDWPFLSSYYFKCTIFQYVLTAIYLDNYNSHCTGTVIVLLAACMF